MASVRAGSLAALAAATALLLACDALRPSRAQDACANPGVPRPLVQSGVAEEGCHEIAIDYREEPSVERVALVRVNLGMRASGDAIGTRHGFYVVRPSGAVMTITNDGRLTPFHALFARFDQGFSYASPLRDYAEQQLGINAAFAGGQCCFDPSYFSEIWLERDGGRFCVAAGLRHPFQGRIRHCGGLDGGQGQAGYAAGYLTTREAPELTCPAFRRDSGRTECWTGGYPWLRPARLPDGRLAYVVTRFEPTGRTVENPPGRIPQQENVLRWFISVVDSCTRDVRSVPPFEDVQRGDLERRLQDFLRSLDFGSCP